MFRSLRKAAASLEKGMETAFSTPPSSHTAFIGATLTIAGINVKLGPVFAEGGYSLIHTAKPLSSSSNSATTRYAVKRISCEDPEARNQAEHEIAFLRQLPPHPNIVKFYDAAFQHNHAFLLFELVDGGTLPERLKSVTLDFPRRLSIFADAVAAVTHLHAQDPPVAIRDVKLENLLYDRLTGCYKLCDFGSVTTKAGRLTSRKEILAAEEDVAGNCTAMYRAPELVDLYSKQFICERIDVWALGCVWHAILFGTLPFDGQSSLQISKGLRQIPSQPTYPEEFISLLKGMLTVDPAKRLDSFSVLETVNRLQGKQIDPNLQRIGLQLRRKRARDFGNFPEELTASPNLLMGRMDPPTTQLPTSQLPALITPTSTTTDYFQQPQVSHEEDSVRSTKDEAEGWADFEAAFGESSAVSRNSTKSGRAKPSMVENAVTTLPGSVPNHASTTTDTTSPLIDFSDLHIGNRPDRSGGIGNHCNQKKVEHNSKSGTSTSHVTDLIDFG